MAINQSNSDKGANGGPTAPLTDRGTSPWANKSPGGEWQGGAKAAGPNLPKRPVGPTPEGFPSRTPRPGARP